MKKNFIFLALILASATTEVSTAERCTREKSSSPSPYNVTQKQHACQASDQLVQTTPSQQVLLTVIELCFAEEFAQATALIQQDSLDINTPIDNQGNGILLIACRMYHVDKRNKPLADILIFLIEQGANPACVNNEGQTILHTVCQYDLDEQTGPVLDLLVKHLQAMVDAIDAHGRHAFHYACLNSSVATSYFIKNNIGKAFLCHHDHQNMTPVCLAAARNTNLDPLFNFKPDYELQGNLLRWAAAKNMIIVVNKLIIAGANVNAENQSGRTALYFAAEQGHTAIIEILLAAPGINVNASGQWSNAALLYAAHKGHTKTVQTLLRAPGINVNAIDRNGNTALHLAAEYDHTATVQALCATPGININATSNNGSTALLYAVYKGHTETVQAFITAGANVNAQSQQGWTALQYAAHQGRTATVQALLTAGADTTLRNHNGQTAAHVAHTPEIRQILQAHVAAHGQ